MGVVSGGGQTTVEIEIFQRGQLPQGWREGDQPRVADGGVGQREALVNISFSPRLSNRHIHHPMPKTHGVGCTPFIPPASLPLAVASCKGPPTMQLGSVAGFGRKLQTASSNRGATVFRSSRFVAGSKTVQRHDGERALAAAREAVARVLADWWLDVWSCLATLVVQCINVQPQDPK